MLLRPLKRPWHQLTRDWLRAHRLKRLIVPPELPTCLKVRLFLPHQKLIQGTCPHIEAARKAHGLSFDQPKAFDYEAFYANEIEKKHKDKSYRYFNNINRVWTSLGEMLTVACRGIP
jgi:hypothetical protein